MNIFDYEEAVSVLEYLMDYLERQEVNDDTVLDDMFQPYLNVHQQKMIVGIIYSELHHDQKLRYGAICQRFKEWNEKMLDGN